MIILVTHGCKINTIEILVIFLILNKLQFGTKSGMIYQCNYFIKDCWADKRKDKIIKEIYLLCINYDKLVV